MRPLLMALENPHLLPLLLAAFLPLLLHLLDRRRARVVDWPAVRFLASKSRARLRRLQLHEALLIIVRSLAVVLIVFSSLGPVSTEARARKIGPRSRGLVLILDTSQSMAYREQAEGPTAFEKAKEGALKILDELSGGDQVGLITEHGSFEKPGEIATDLRALRGVVKGLRPQSGSFHLVSALDRAADLLQGMTRAWREIYVFTDLQASILPDRDPARLRFLKDRLAAAKAAVRGTSEGARLPTWPWIHIIDCGSLHPENRFVSSLEAGPLAAGVDEPAAFKALLETHGSAEEGTAKNEPVQVRLEDGDEVVATASVIASAGLPAIAEFEHRFVVGGKRRVSAEAPPDGLPEDDTRRLVVEVLDRIGVLIVGTSRDAPTAGTARFVDLALAPPASDRAAPSVLFRPQFAASLKEVELSSSRVVILAGLLNLDAAEALKLEAFVKEGGGLLIFGGSGVDPLSLTAQLYEEGQGILPARLAERGGRPGEASHPRDILTSHPALEVFKDPEEGDLSKITIHAWTKVGELARDARVLARIDADSPWIIEKDAGKGKVVLFTTSAAPCDSDLPLTPLFLPLLHKQTRYLAGREATLRPLVTGEVISMPVPPGEGGKEAFLILPDGTRSPLPPSLEGGELRFSFRDTRVPGFYEVRFEEAEKEGEGGSLKSHLFAVNLPVEESRLERLEKKALDELCSSIDLEVLRDVRDASGPISAVDQVKIEHWPAALALAQALLFFELFLARSFSRGRIRSKIAGPEEGVQSRGPSRFP